MANPNNEGSAGFHDRNEINPLRQLRALSGKPAAFSYTPANSPTGQPVPCSTLSSDSSNGAAPSTTPGAACTARSGLQRSSGSSVESLAADRLDKTVNYSTVSPAGRLAGGKMYKWDGWLYVPLKDSYVFRIQHSTALPDDNVHFTLDDSQKSLVEATSFYQGSWYGGQSVVVSPTDAGYVEGGLKNRQCALPAEKRVRNPQTLVRCAESPSIGWHKVTLTVDATSLPASSEVSVRFAVSAPTGTLPMRQRMPKAKRSRWCS